MASVYVAGPEGKSTPMSRVRCKNEGMELQRLLECNFDLLAGDQIDPGDPRRWILVRREMPVPDPNTGVDRWSIDFFFLDQDAVPTFVECKRFEDTRSRREVVGQVLEYAANGQHYWRDDQMRRYAEETLLVTGTTLEEAIHQLKPTDDLGPEEFFPKAQENLRLGQVRIVFFLEESPFELRSIVDFLNKQMASSEVLIVEARRYERDDLRIVVPSLFGYTDQARLVKGSVVVSSSGLRRRWDADGFFAEASRVLSEPQVATLRRLYQKAMDLGFVIKWGTGNAAGSCSFVADAVCPRSVMTIGTKGGLCLNFGWLNGSEAAENVRETLKRSIEANCSATLPADYQKKFPSIPAEKWMGEVDGICKTLEEVAAAAGSGVA